MIAEGVAVPDPSGHIEIVLVEDNPTDAELCLRSLKGHNLANNIVWLRDGAEALDYLFSRGAYSGRKSAEKPTLVIARPAPSEDRRERGFEAYQG